MKSFIYFCLSANGTTAYGKNKNAIPKHFKSACLAGYEKRVTKISVSESFSRRAELGLSGRISNILHTERFSAFNEGKV